jgi:hypothetical protein
MNPITYDRNFLHRNQFITTTTYNIRKNKQSQIEFMNMKRFNSLFKKNPVKITPN